jgi:hypothetical protein
MARILVIVYLVIIGLEFPHAYKAAASVTPEDRRASFLTAVAVSIIWPILFAFGLLSFGLAWLFRPSKDEQDKP